MMVIVESESRPALFVHFPGKIVPPKSVSVVWVWTAVLKSNGVLIFSAQFVVIVTSLVYQPLRPLGTAGFVVNVKIGALLSSFTSSGRASVDRPALLVQEPVNVRPVVSVVWV